MDSEFTVNGKSVSPWMGWSIAAGVLLLAFAAIATILILVAVYAGLLFAFALLVVLTLLPFDLALKLFGRKGFFELRRSMTYYDDEKFWQQEEFFSKNQISLGYDGWQRSYVFGTRPLRKAMARK